jgi:hypothetical protein
LVPQREVFEDQGAVGPDPAEEADEDEGDHAGHHRSGRAKVNVDKVDGVSRRHRHELDRKTTLDRPSQGRYRQAHQRGLQWERECIGVLSLETALEASLIHLLRRFTDPVIRRLGLIRQR